MTARIDATFAALKAQAKAGLVTFSMAFDPDRERSLAILKSLPEAGADIIEIGMPFSDPMADGPVIQAAGIRALIQGATLKGVLELVRQFRTGNTHTPLILMGYYNPIFIYGAERFAKDAKEAGLDGVIIVDLPMEERAELQPALDTQDIAFINLITPTTGDARVQTMLRGAKGFVYYVAVAGITGQKSADNKVLETRIRHLKTLTPLPIAVGFGVKSAEQVKEISAFSDAVVVGSALVAEIEKDAANAAEFVRKLRS